MTSFIIILHFITGFYSFIFDNPQVSKVVNIDAVKMSYSIKEFSVKSLSLVEIHFTNKDLIRHNLLIIEPGTLEKVGALADELATTPDGVKSEWVPETSEVLFFTPLVSKEDKYILQFKAPEKKGKYPFVCTFPTHWRMMNGIMVVE